MLTIEQVESLPIGRVLKRFLSPTGSHSRMKIVKPTKFNFCEICGAKNLKKIVKTEMGGNIHILAQCLKCAVDELNEVSHE